MKYQASRKSKKCPKCEAMSIARIMYGMPVWSTMLEEDITKKTVVLGGCCVTDNDPLWQCTNCHTEIYMSNKNKALQYKANSKKDNNK